MQFNHPLELPKSDHIIAFEWTGDRVSCPAGFHGDTYPMTWAADDQIYMSAGDPNWIYIDGKPCGMTWQEAFERMDLYPHMGGLDIEKLTNFGADFSITQVNTMPGLMGPGGNGPKPSGMISVKGSLYLAAQNLLGKKDAPHRVHSQHGSDATILRSDDFGKTWFPDIQSGLAEMEAQLYDRRRWMWKNQPQERVEWKGWSPMFPGPWFGGPTFIQYGRDHAGAVDEYIYAVSGDQWDNGSQLRLGRVLQDQILDRSAWTFADIRPDGSVRWVASPEDSLPVLTIHGHISLPEMVYIPSLGRYLLLTWGLHKDFDVSHGSELTILESQYPWGPFYLVHYEEMWDKKEVCPYCPRIPLKWFNSQTLTGWILHSGNWHSPEPYYKAHVRPFRLRVS